MLKRSVARIVSASEEETSGKHKIKVDVDPPPMNNILVVP